MNIIIFYVRLITGVALCGISCGFFFTGEPKTGITALVVAGALLLPVVRAGFNYRNLLPAASGKKSRPLYSILSIMRWSIGFILCLAAIGGVLQKEYLSALCMLSMGLLFISPADGFIFNHRSSGNAALKTQAFVSRNLGTGFHVLAIGLYTTNDILAAGTFWGLAIVLLFLHPVIDFLRHGNIVIEPGAVAATRDHRQPTDNVGAEPVIVQQETSIDANELTKLKSEFESLSKLNDPQQRGYAFQVFLNSLFSFYGLQPRQPFRLTGEEIDGSFELDSHVYLVEAKWQAQPTGLKDLLTFHGKVEGKASWARGVFISYNGFTKEGLEAYGRGRRTNTIGIDGQDIVSVLEGSISLRDLIFRKIRISAETNAFFVPVSKLMV
jgi:hypothetical protein